MPSIILYTSQYLIITLGILNTNSSNGCPVCYWIISDNKSTSMNIQITNSSS